VKKGVFEQTVPFVLNTRQL